MGCTVRAAVVPGGFYFPMPGVFVCLKILVRIVGGTATFVGVFELATTWARNLAPQVVNGLDLYLRRS